MKSRAFTIVFIVIFVIGLSLLLYPTVSDWWNSFHQSRNIAAYVEAVANLSTEAYDELFEAAEAYNARLASDSGRWTMTEEELEEYNSLLRVGDTGVMGYIQIAKINVTLPIYHGTDEAVLQIAIGHVEGSSLPVGGEGTHCVLSGHRGLPSAKLFTDISELEAGDTFVLQILDRTLTYEVDQIRVVLPEEMDSLTITDDGDYCTLVTCTPYGVNTHRLLVRGHRVENERVSANVTAEAIRFETVIVAPFIAAPIVLIAVIAVFIRGGRRRGHRSDRN